jgi:hypothetical protein
MKKQELTHKEVKNQLKVKKNLRKQQLRFSLKINNLWIKFYYHRDHRIREVRDQKEVVRRILSKRIFSQNRINK